MAGSDPSISTNQREALRIFDEGVLRTRRLRASKPNPRIKR